MVSLFVTALPSLTAKSLQMLRKESVGAFVSFTSCLVVGLDKRQL